MFTKQIIILFVTLAVAALALAFSPNAAPAFASVKSAPVAGLVPPTAPDSLSTIAKFHAALKARDTAAILPLLATDIVLLETKPAPCPSQTTGGVQAVEKAFAYSQALSFSVKNVRADRDKVTYAMTEWMDPRIVGPNYPQPVKSHVTAVVQFGQIVSITTTRDADWVTSYNDGLQTKCW